MKVAASPRIYMGRCPKVVFKSLATNLWLLIPAFKFLAVTPEPISLP